MLCVQGSRSHWKSLGIVDGASISESNRYIVWCVCVFVMVILVLLCYILCATVCYKI